MNKVIKEYISTPYIVCVLVLAIAAAGMQYTISSLNLILVKKPINLQKPFDDIDENAIYPYKVVKKTKIKNPAILESLGTEDYIQWVLEDQREPAESPTRYCSLFLTYYTGINDRIPHVPEECYFGGGNTRDDLEDITLKVKCPNYYYSKNGIAEVPVRLLVFSKKNADPLLDSEEFPVVYFLNVNGEFAGNRTQARATMGKNVLGTYSFFSKVEWRFYGNSGYPNIDEVKKASVKMLEVILPVLIKDHWPDIKAAEEAAKSS